MQKTPKEPSTELKVAITDYRNTEAALIDARKRLGKAISNDRRAGVPQTAICKAANFTREYVRKLQAAAEKAEEQTA